MITLPELYAYWARFRPEADAVVCEDVRYSWQQLYSHGQALAAQLQQRGIVPGDRVGILIGNSAQWVAAYVGPTLAGAILVPLNARFGRFESRAIEEDAQCAAIITTRHDGQSLNDRLAYGEGAADEIILASPIAQNIAAQNLEDIFATRAKPAPIAAQPDALSAIFYTSGSTGLPKGTMQTHESIMAYVFAYTGLQFSSEDRALIVAPLAFTGGCLSLLIPMLAIGACSVIEKALVPERILRLIVEERISFITQVPAIWDRLPQLPAWPEADLSSLRIALTGGAPVPVSLLQQFREKNVRIRQVYGATEIGSMGCYPPEALSMERPETVGYPQATLQMRIVRDGKDCAIGEAGELWFKGPQVMKGYWRAPEATAAAFDNGYYKTGDLGKMHEDGSISIVDRLKNMIISGGVNIYPAEIERALASIPAILESGVFGVPDEKWGERVVAIVYADGPLDLEAIREEARALLGPLKAPREILVATAAAAKTVTNKISRVELPKLYHELAVKEDA